MNDKAEFQFPNTEHGNGALSVNDARLIEARSAVEALTLVQTSRNPELYKNPEAVELLAIGEEIERLRQQTRYGLAA